MPEGKRRVWRHAVMAIAVLAAVQLLPWVYRAQAQPARGLTLSEMQSERRLALVIGNGAYQTGPLNNPPSDARLMAATLRSVGFEVSEHIDVDQRAMKIAIRDFGRRLTAGGVGLFYFAGHGVQLAGRNYLIPLGAKIDAQDDIDIESVDLAAVLAKMSSAQNRLNIVILDACRNNPYATAFRSPSRGLAQVSAPRGTLLAYATSPGQVALDGAGANGTYTAALAAEMQRSKVEIGPLFRAVRTNVRTSTGGRQIPWESSSLEGEFYFVLPSGEPATGREPAPVPTRTPPAEITATPAAQPAPADAPRGPVGRSPTAESRLGSGSPNEPGGQGAAPWVIAGFTIAGACAIAGTVTGALTIAQGSDLQEACQDDLCAPEQQEDLDTATALGHASTALFIVGGLGAAVGVVALAVGSSRDSSAAGVTVQPRIGPGFVGIGGEF